MFLPLTSLKNIYSYLADLIPSVSQVSLIILAHSRVSTQASPKCSIHSPHPLAPRRSTKASFSWDRFSRSSRMCLHHGQGSSRNSIPRLKRSLMYCWLEHGKSWSSARSGARKKGLLLGCSVRIRFRMLRSMYS